MDPPNERKRKSSDDATVMTCSIGQRKSIDSGESCKLCQTEKATFERNIRFSIGKVSTERTTLLQVCDGCSEVLDKLRKFRTQAFCSSKYLLDSKASNVHPRICRFCFVTGDELVDLFDEHGRGLDLKLLDHMRDWLEIVFYPRDSVTKLCRACARSVAALAMLGIGPSMDIAYMKKGSAHSDLSESSKSSNSKISRKVKRDSREDENLLQLLQMPNVARNFTVLTDDVEPRIQVVYEKFMFRLFKRFPTGTTIWKCVHNRLQFCAAEIDIDASGTSAVLKGRHSHAAGPVKLLEYPQGKGRIRIDGVEKTFWLTYGASGKSPYTRTLFLGGHRYYMTKIAAEGSRWFCHRSWDSGCRVSLTVAGHFETIKMCGPEHTHDPCPDDKIKRYLKDCGVVNFDMEDAREGSSQMQAITASVAEPDRAQNYVLKLTGSQKVLITFERHDFQWRDKTASWCCVWSKIRRCPVKILLSPDGKLANLVDPTSEHNHSDEVVAIFWQKFGKHQIYDEHECDDFYCHLSDYELEHQPNRRIIYQGYRYRLATITDSGDSVWKCEQCEATVRVMGLFWLIDYRCLHSHGPLSLQELDNDEDLLPYKSTELTGGIPRSPSALLKLLAVDKPERNFQMQYRKNLMKILQDGFEYCYTASKPNYSLWRCFYSKIRGCGAALHVDNDGRIGTPSTSTVHNHSIQLWDLYYYRLGEGSIQDELTKAHTPFVFLIKPDFVRPLPHLIYQGHLFTMIFITELGERSKWKCVGTECAVTANVTGLFEMIGVDGLPHCDEPLREEEKRECIAKYGTPDEF